MVGRRSFVTITLTMVRHPSCRSATSFDPKRTFLPKNGAPDFLTPHRIFRGLQEFTRNWGTKETSEFALKIS